VILALIFGTGVLALLAAVFLLSNVLKRSTGSDAMRAISDAIKEGAEAFMRRQNMTILLLAGSLAVLLFVVYGVVRTPNQHDPCGDRARICNVDDGFVCTWRAVLACLRLHRNVDGDSH
jgi:K(+)-stimulated pyrophosphate-energized sodium pump